MNFFDGQGILIRGDAYRRMQWIKCTQLGERQGVCRNWDTTEGNIADWNTVNSVGMEIVPVADAAEATAELVSSAPVMLSLATCQQWSLRNTP